MKPIILALAVVTALGGCAPVAEQEATENRASSIVGGTFSGRDNAVVLVETRGESARSYCTGTVIRARFVLTGAHCVSAAALPFVPLTFSVVTQADASQGISDARRLTVARAIPHPDYRPAGDKVVPNDIALLELEQPTKIAARDIHRGDLRDESTARVVGYGRTDDDVPESILVKHQATVRITEIAAQSFLARGVDGQSQCLGDSGGPTFIRVGGREVIAGISWSTKATSGCDEGNVNLRVAAFAEWIDGVAR